jgi:DnaJ domain
MADGPTYYQILGVDPAADAATIDAAYHGRSLRLHAGSFLDRREPAGPTQVEIERAYAVLRDPAARARYDAALAGGGPAAAFRWPALPAWLPWATAGVLCLLAVGILAAAISRSRSAPSADPISRILNSDSGVSATRTASAALPTEAEVAPTADAAATLAAGPPPATSAPPQPSATATVAPAPRPTTAPPAQAPPAPAVGFVATDQVGTILPVDLRAGPGTRYVAQGTVSPGTLLAATGETAQVNGVLWRRFRLPDGRVGWVRDNEVSPAQ